MCASKTNLMQSSFDRVPNEVLEQIFASVPLMDLLRICSLVCTRWKGIIWRREFMPYKKAYYRYKLLPKEELVVQTPENDLSQPPAKRARLEPEMGEEEPEKIEDSDTEEEPLWIHFDFFTDLNREDFHFNNNWINDKSTLASDSSKTETLVPSLIKYASQKFGWMSKRFVQIQRHPKAGVAKKWLEVTMPEIQHREVAVVVLLCSIAQDAWDVKAIFKALLAPSIGTTCSSLDASELLYFVALAFLRFSRTLDFPIRFHYNVFQAIYFFENSFNFGSQVKSASSSPRKGQQSLMSFGFVKREASINLTAEQFRIIRHNLDPKTRDVIKIVAFAGTGKTTTLINLCKENPNLKFLVVMYNRSVKEHAEKVFPKNNVKCTTAHSIAFRKWGFMFNKKLTSNLKAIDIIDSDLLSEAIFDGKEKTSLQKRAAQVLKTVENFFNSSDFQISEENVPSFWHDFNLRDDIPLNADEKQWVLENSIRVWQAMNDKENTKVKMPHDGYLKAYQLRRPDLQRISPHDVLLIDEAQDMNPAMLDVFLNQNTPKVLVGDPNQQIYLFRGAVNALGSVESTHTYYLTQSFRFGPEIGFAADSFLQTQKGVDRQTLVGGQKIDQIVSRSDLDSKDKEFRPVAIIGRTNMGIFAEVVKLVCDAEPSKRPTASFAGGVGSYNFDDYLDIYHLSVGQNDKMKKWKKFRSFDAFQQFAKNTNDNDLISKIECVKAYGKRLPGLIDKLGRFCNFDPRNSDYVFTTVHKSKGLEWQSVVLLDDFREIPGVLTSIRIKAEEDEKNLLYVAMTRAKKYLAINSSILNLMCTIHHNFESVNVSNKSEELGTVCVDCEDSRDEENNLFHFKRKKAEVDGVVRRKVGILCSICAGTFVQKCIARRGDSHFRTKFADSTRQALRYFCGPLQDKMEKARELCTRHEFENGNMFFLAMNQEFQDEIDFEDG